MSNCKETSIPQVDNSQLPCCEIVNTFCVSHAEELPNLGLPENSLVSDILNTIDENISDIGSYISDISLVGNGLTIVGENSAFSGTIDFSGLQLVVANITDFPTIPQNTSDLTNNGVDGTSTYVENDELSDVATSGDYADLSNVPIFKVVENEYTNVSAMYADQGSQTNTFIQYVIDASGFPNTPTIVGDKYFEYLGTTNGDETDYRLLSDEESAPIVNSITKTSDIPTNDGATGVSPYAELIDLPIAKRVVASVTGSYNFDHSVASDWKITITGDTTFTDSNLPTGDNTIEFTIKMTGDFTPTFPVYWDVVGDVYDGNVWNFLAVQVHNGNPAAEEVTVFLTDLS